jgi:MFS family permease
VIGTFGFNFTVILPLIARFVLNTGAAGFGALTAFLGVGSLAAAVVMAYSRKVTTQRMLLAAGAFGLILGALALSSSFALSTALLVVLGFVAITFATTANSLLQLKVPDELRGRVMSLYFLLFAGSTPVGGLLLGVTSDRLGVQAALLLCAALCIVGVGGALLYRRVAAKGRGEQVSEAA